MIILNILVYLFVAAIGITGLAIFSAITYHNILDIKENGL